MFTLEVASGLFVVAVVLVPLLGEAGTAASAILLV
jgi:hypothetical protein